MEREDGTSPQGVCVCVYIYKDSSMNYFEKY